MDDGEGGTQTEAWGSPSFAREGARALTMEADESGLSEIPQHDTAAPERDATESAPMETEEQDVCSVCHLQLDGDAFVWPGCHRRSGSVAHRLHRHCLGGIFASLPDWPAHRPDQPGLLRCIQEGLRRAQPIDSVRAGEQPRLQCPTCRHPWMDIPALAGVLQ